MPRAKTSDVEKKGGELSRRDRVRAVVNTLRGDHPGKIYTGEDYTMPWAVRRLPFGIADLDVATNGGAPAGGLTMLVGKPGEGKNFLLNRLVRNQQQLYGEDCAVAMIGTELAYDKTQGRSVGVRVALSNDEIDAMNAKQRELHNRDLTKEEVAELKTQVGEFLVVPPSTAEEAFDIAVDLVRSGEFNIVGLDSFGSILPEGDEDKDFADGDARVGGAAGLNTQLMRKLNNAFAPLSGGRPNLTCFVGINQVRDKLKAQPFEKQTHESGGWSLKHGRFLTIELSRIAYVRDEKTKAAIAKRIGWEITKQKAGGYEGHKGEYTYVMSKSDIDEGELLLRVGEFYGLIEKSGNTYSYNGQRMGVGVAQAAAWIVKCGLEKELNEEILHAARVTLVT